MRVTVRLAEARLHYGAGLTVHTAASGPVDALREIYLIVEQDGALTANAAVRVNISYLNGIPEEAAVADISAAVAAMDWSAEFAAVLVQLPALAGTRLAVSRDLIDCALHDGLARRAGQPLAAWLGGPIASKLATNQTLFWSDRKTILERAGRYVDRGFRSLKLRCGLAPFSEDLDRLSALREAFGADIALSLDVNGRWTEDAAVANFRALETLGLEYVEEPLARHDWAGLKRLSAGTAIPIMLDESISSRAEVEKLARSKAAQGAHLKLVKLGGIAPVLSAAAMLRDAGIEIMIGQMNEGGLATAAAAHCALAAEANRAELYGADGLLDDPASGLRYEGGLLHLTGAPGLGLDADTQTLRTFWEKTL